MEPRNDPRSLKRGLNRIELLSDTEHHSMEVIYPGSALMVRRRTRADEDARALRPGFQRFRVKL